MPNLGHTHKLLGKARLMWAATGHMATENEGQIQIKVHSALPFQVQQLDEFATVPSWLVCTQPCFFKRKRIALATNNREEEDHFQK